MERIKVEKRDLFSTNTPFDVSSRFEFYYFYLIVRIYSLVLVFFYFIFEIVILPHRVKFFFDFPSPIFLSIVLALIFFLDDFSPFYFYLFQFVGIIFSSLSQLQFF